MKLKILYGLSSVLSSFLSVAVGSHSFLRTVERNVTGEGKAITPDLGGKAKTSQVTDEVIAKALALAK